MIQIQSVPNVDRLAAEHGQKFVENAVKEKLKASGVGNTVPKASDIENTVTKALGVLQENGVYACFLYLYAKEETNGELLVKEMLSLLSALGFREIEKTDEEDFEKVLDFLTNHVTNDLERLLFAKDALETMLIYARYSAKAYSA